MLATHGDIIIIKILLPRFLIPYSQEAQIFMNGLTAIVSKNLCRVVNFYKFFRRWTLVQMLADMECRHVIILIFTASFIIVVIRKFMVHKPINAQGNI